ncbi:hypothetical protein OG21DRAFT_1500144 [Imleria badia]|nr:hypothetical protein OG21DRAFT_1500144 [Imleria badia]
MSNDDSASQYTLSSTLYVSTIEIRLAMGSGKKIESIKLKKNDGPLRLSDVQKTICAGGVHREEFHPLLALNPDDHIFVSVDLRLRLRKRVDIIDINLHNTECIRDEQDVRWYRKKARKVEVVVAVHCQPSGVGKSSLIHKVFGVDDVHTSENDRGITDIDREFISSTNERFVVHDSLGFEAGDERNIDKVKEFVRQRKAMPQLKDQLHAIWLCLEIPYCGGRLLEAGAEKFLQDKDEILGNSALFFPRCRQMTYEHAEVPLVVVLTKVDSLDVQLEMDLPEGETLDNCTSRYLNEHCIGPLRRAAGSDITHVTVSVEDGYSESLTNLVEATKENMAKYHVHEAPRFVACIAQRVSIKEKIELSIAVGKKKYWKMLLMSAVFRGHTLHECLQVIRKDIVTVWNLKDPDKFAGLLAAGLELVKPLSGSGEITLAVLAPVAGFAISVAQTTYTAYHEVKKDVKILMAYIVNLVCVVQAIFVLSSGGHVTPEAVALAVGGCERQRRSVRALVNEFDGKLGVLLGGRDYVLEKVEEWIWCYSIADHEIEELRQRLSIGQVLPSSSS